MFRNKISKRHYGFIAAGFVAITAYIAYVFQQDSEEDSSIALNVATLATATLISGILPPSSYPLLSDKKEEFAQRIITPPVSSTYPRNDQIKDIEFLASLFVEVQEGSALDYCKIHNLMNSPDFKFEISETIHEGSLSGECNGAFKAELNKIEFPPFIHKKDKNFVRNTIAHEFRHGIDSFNNFQKGVCLFNTGSKLVGMANMYGNAAEYEDCFKERDAGKRFMYLFVDDARRIAALFRALNKDYKKLTPQEKADLKKFSSLIQKSDYKRGTIHIRTTDNYINKYKKEYGFDKPSNRIILETDEYDTVVKKECSFIEMKFTINRYAKYIDIHSKTIAFGFSRNNDFSSKVAEVDLLSYIITELDKMFNKNNYDPLVVPFEIGAHVEGILSRYSNVIAGVNTSLYDWLFPSVTEYLKERDSAQQVACLAEQSALRRLK